MGEPPRGNDGSVGLTFQVSQTVLHTGQQAQVILSWARFFRNGQGSAMGSGKENCIVAGFAGKIKNLLTGTRTWLLDMTGLPAEQSAYGSLTICRVAALSACLFKVPSV